MWEKDEDIRTNSPLAYFDMVTFKPVFTKLNLAEIKARCWIFNAQLKA